MVVAGVATPGLTLLGGQSIGPENIHGTLGVVARSAATRKVAGEIVHRGELVLLTAGHVGRALGADLFLYDEAQEDPVTIGRTFDIEFHVSAAIIRVTHGVPMLGAVLDGGPPILRCATREDLRRLAAGGEPITKYGARTKRTRGRIAGAPGPDHDIVVVAPLEVGGDPPCEVGDSGAIWTTSDGTAVSLQNSLSGSTAISRAMFAVLEKMQIDLG